MFLGEGYIIPSLDEVIVIINNYIDPLINEYKNYDYETIKFEYEKIQKIMTMTFERLNWCKTEEDVLKISPIFIKVVDTMLKISKRLTVKNMEQISQLPKDERYIILINVLIL